MDQAEDWPGELAAVERLPAPRVAPPELWLSWLRPAVSGFRAERRGHAASRTAAAGREPLARNGRGAYVRPEGVGPPGVEGQRRCPQERQLETLPLRAEASRIPGAYLRGREWGGGIPGANIARCRRRRNAARGRTGATEAAAKAERSEAEAYWPWCTRSGGSWESLHASGLEHWSAAAPRSGTHRTRTVDASCCASVITVTLDVGTDANRLCLGASRDSTPGAGLPRRIPLATPRTRLEPSTSAW